MAQWDIFLSHASEDKADVATPLAEKLRALGLTVWLDDRDNMTPGGTVLGTIDYALANSDYGVVVLSQHYFAKHWTKSEVAALVDRESGGRKGVFPVLHKITPQEVKRHSPVLGAHNALVFSHGVEVVAQQIFRAIHPEVINAKGESATPNPGHLPERDAHPTKSRRWLLAAAVVVCLLGAAGWIGYKVDFWSKPQPIHPEQKPTYAEESALPAEDGEKSGVVIAANPVTAPTPVLEAPVDQQPARVLTAYERALQMPGVEPVEGKQGSGSLKRVLDLDNGQKLTLLWVEPGEFFMGSPTTEVGRDEDEPQHRVILTEDFFLGETEVTQGQWMAVMGTEPWKDEKFAKEGENVAASYITYDKALEFCRRLNESQQAGQRPPAGWVFGLPSEVRWEFACRAGTTTAYCSGDRDEDLSRVAIYFSNREGSYAHPVRSKAPNDWGFFDMHGNVWEWVLDAYSDGKAFRDGEEVPPVDGPSSASRVVRGGSWDSNPRGCRSAVRFGGGPWIRLGVRGFRLCLLPGPGAPLEEK